MTSFRRICRILAFPMVVVTFFSLGVLPAAQAALVPTDQTIGEAAAKTDRERVMTFLQREDVRQQMETLGIDPDEAAARAAALSDREIGQIAGRLDQEPAGGVIGAVIGAAVLIFIVLLITDILCLTEVFPFTKCVKK